MGTDIHIHVEVLDSGRWRNVTPEAVPIWHPMNNGPVEIYPEDRCYPVFRRLADMRGCDIRGMLAFDGLPDDWDWRGLDECERVTYPYTLPATTADEARDKFGDDCVWATVAHLQASDWTLREADRGGVIKTTDLSNCYFVRWLYGERLAKVINAAGGPTSVRVIVGFRS